MNIKKMLTIILSVISVGVLASAIVFLNKWLVYPFAAILIIYFCFVLFLKIALRFIPSFKVGESREGRIRFIATALVCTVFFYLAVWYANKYFLPGIFYPKSLLGDAGIFFLSLTVGLCLLKPGGKMISFTVFLSVVLLAFLLIDFEFDGTNKGASSNNIKSLGYLAYVKEDKEDRKEGVIKYKKGLTNEGINIYNSWELPGAYLVDMSGNVMHKWWMKESSPKWQYVKLLANGDLLLIIKDDMFVRLDWDSNVRWTNKERFHHEIIVAENGDIHTLTRGEEWISFYGLPVPILNDYLTILSEDGVIKKKISFFKLLKDKIPAKRFIEVMVKAGSPGQVVEIIQQKLAGEPAVREASIFDIIHTNTLKIIDRDINEIFKKGNIIFCAAEQDIIGVLDLEKERVLWTWGRGYLELPHYPTLLENGNILIFDNGVRREFSRVVELNPSNEEIVWKYEENPPGGFFSPWGGANQVLPNGNILLTYSTAGRVFEITREGEIVWEFYNPVRDEQGRRGTVYRMMRIMDIGNYDNLNNLLIQKAQLNTN